MRYEGDINAAQQMEINIRAALLKDNAPDSKPIRHWFESTVEQQFLLSTDGSNSNASDNEKIQINYRIQYELP